MPTDILSRIKDVWIGFGGRNIAKQVIMHCTFMVFGSEAACIGETVACSCEQLSEQNF